MAKATVGKALHYLSQHTELMREQKGSRGEMNKQTDFMNPSDGLK